MPAPFILSRFYKAMLASTLFALCACAGGSGSGGAPVLPSDLATPSGGAAAPVGLAAPSAPTYELQASGLTQSGGGPGVGPRQGSLTRVAQDLFVFTTPAGTVELAYDAGEDAFLGTRDLVDVEMRVFSPTPAHHALIQISESSPAFASHTVAVLGDETGAPLVAEQVGIAAYSGPSILLAAAADGSTAREMGTFTLLTNFNTGAVTGTVFAGGGVTLSLTDGEIAGGGVTGNLASVQVDGLTGSAEGVFYGPNADGIGGTFQGAGEVGGQPVSLGGAFASQ
ncbi:MAG: transferrin-binding protein-like solute binding protein [Pseudomonadota bacterium]